MNNEMILIQRECGRRQKDLAHTIDGRARAVAAIDNHGWCNLHMPEVMLNYKGKCDEYWRHYKLWFGHMPENPIEREIDDQISEARFYKIGRFAFLLVEAVAASVLGVIFFNAPQLIAMMIGVGLAVLLGAAAAAVVARWVRHGAATQPTKQMERVTRGLLALGLPWLAACVTALAVLRTQGTAAGAGLFFVVTTTVTVLSPLCSGLCGYAGDLLLWSKRLCGDMRWIRSVGRQIDNLLATSARNIPTSSAAGTLSNTPVNQILKAIGTTTAILILLTSLARPTIAQGGELPIYIYADVSPSAREGDVIRVLKAFSSRLSNYKGENTFVITLVPFYEDAFMATSLLQVAIPGNRVISCEATGTDNEIERLSKTYADAARRNAARQCSELRVQTRREDIAHRATEMAKLVAAFDQLSGLNLHGRCTAVNAIIRRAVRETPTGIAIVVSDLDNSCASQGLSANLRPENQIFLIPVGSRQHSIEEGFDGLQARFARTMPWAQVIEPFRLDSVIDSIMYPGTRITARR